MLAAGALPDNGELDILLVEDSEVDALTIERWLARLDWVQVRRAESLTEALDLLGECMPDLALVDLSLPDARHLEVVSKLVAAAPELAIVVQTGSDDLALAEAALQLGAQDYLSKDSLSSEILVRSIRYTMARTSTLSVLGETNVRLEAVDAEMDQFVGVLAHDLRAPVRTARLLSERLLDRLESDDPVVEDLGRRYDETMGRLDAMVLSLLGYASLRRGIETDHSVSLADVASSVRDDLEADLHAVGGRVDIDAPHRVTGEPELLQRLLANLVSNALKHGRGAVPPLVTIRSYKTPAAVLVTVADNGPGIAPADRERVFGLLERLEPDSTAGLGFGLAISRRIVECHGGEISVSSAPGGGASFELTFPDSVEPTPVPASRVLETV